MHASGSAVSPHQQHIYPRHPHLRHAGDGDDDLFLVRLAQVQISPIPQRLPAEGFKQDETVVCPLLFMSPQAMQEAVNVVGDVVTGARVREALKLSGLTVSNCCHGES